MTRDFSNAVLVATGLLMSAAGLAQGAEVKRGAFAIHYSSPLSEEELAWYSRFDALVTHDALPRGQVNRLHAAGTRLLFYEWSVAFYDSRATGWQRSLLKERPKNLLNDVPLTGGAGDAAAAAWYFDPASPGYASARTSDLARRLKVSGYDGVFFDTTTFASVHPDARNEYMRRHPDLAYDVAFAKLFVQLRRKLPRVLIYTNQGYRSPENYLPYVDADLTESLITRPGGGAFEVRPWNDSSDPWNSIRFVMSSVVEPLEARYPRVRFLHLNYTGTRENGGVIPLVFAVARLFGGEGYVASDVSANERDEIYFRDFGKPLSARVELANGDVAYREFERGIIAVTASRNPIAIDVLNITLPATSGTPSAFFFDNRR